MLITRNLLKRHGGTILCKVCGQPIKEGEPAAKRRVNSRVRYFHPGCIYAEKKPTEDESR